MNRLTEEEKAILQEEVIKITDILEKEDLSDDKRKYLNDLKKYMADKMRGSRKPVKDLKKENILKGACNKILKNRLKKGGVNHNLSLVKGRQSVVVDKELENKQKKFIRKRMIMMKKTLKNKKLHTIPEYKGGRKSRKNNRKSRK
jgi:hypothetical protein